MTEKGRTTAAPAIKIAHLDAYARFCKFVERHFSLEKAAELFPEEHLNADEDWTDKDWTDKRRPFNHFWTKFVESGGQCCLLVQRTMHANFVHRRLLFWYHRQDEPWIEAHRHGMSGEMLWSGAAHRFFFRMLTDFCLGTVSQALGRSVAETEPGAADGERSVTTFWLSLPDREKRLLSDFFAARMRE